MNIVKGFRFHPTDEELIEYLHIKTFDRDSLVQVIDEIQDICESEPGELAGRSALQTGDRLWYFMYPPKYKYRNSKRISRTTLEGYWKPTGNARKIINPDTGVEIGSKKTLVFYKGQCNDKIKNKTCWVMHEYELKASPTAPVSNQKTYNLCKLKKKAYIPSTEAGQSNQHSVSNSKNCEAHKLYNDLRNSDRPSEPEASNDCDVVHNQSSSIETYAGERSNQHNMVNEAEGSNLSSNFINYVAEYAAPAEQNEPDDNTRVQNSYKAIEQDDKSCNSILTNDNESVPTERSNQHNIVVAAEGSELPFNLEYLDGEDLIPTDLLYKYNNGLSIDELLGELEAPNNPDWIQKQNITNVEDEFLNSIFADENETYLQGDRQQGLAADNEGFDLPCKDVMESFNSVGKTQKRPRVEYDGLSHQAETGEAQPWGKECPNSSKSIQTNSYDRIVKPRIEGSITYK
ncbi:hypothetical protein PTKIN_Ptkin15bG0138900 [Pterospermum kingtungense]